MKNRIRWSYVVIALVVPIVFALGLCGFVPAYGCPWHHWLGVECPMCGSTRAWLALGCGDWRAAFRLNPIFWMWGFWTAVAYLELWQRALAPESAPIGTALIRRVAHRPMWMAMHAVFIVGAGIYLNWG